MQLSVRMGRQADSDCYGCILSQIFNMQTSNYITAVKIVLYNSLQCMKFGLLLILGSFYDFIRMRYERFEKDDSPPAFENP